MLFKGILSVAGAIMLAPATALAQSEFQHHQAMVDIAATPPWDHDDYGGADDGPSYSSDEWRDWSEEPPVVLDTDTIANIASSWTADGSTTCQANKPV